MPGSIYQPDGGQAARGPPRCLALLSPPPPPPPPPTGQEPEPEAEREEQQPAAAAAPADEAAALRFALSQLSLLGLDEAAGEALEEAEPGEARGGHRGSGGSPQLTDEHPGRQEEKRQHDRVRARAQLRARRRDRGTPRLQNQSPACQDQHVHQDASQGRGARFHRDREEGGRGDGQEGDPLGRRALLHDPGDAQQSERADGRHAGAPQPAGTDHHPGEGPVPRGGAGGGPQGSHHQAHPAADAHLHRDAQPGQGARLRGDGHARERGPGPGGDRGAHHHADRLLHRRQRRQRLPHQRHRRLPRPAGRRGRLVGQSPAPCPAPRRRPAQRQPQLPGQRLHRVLLQRAGGGRQPHQPLQHQQRLRLQRAAGLAGLGGVRLRLRLLGPGPHDAHHHLVALRARRQPPAGLQRLLFLRRRLAETRQRDGHATPLAHPARERRRGAGAPLGPPHPERPRQHLVLAAHPRLALLLLHQHGLLLLFLPARQHLGRFGLAHRLEQLRRAPQELPRVHGVLRERGDRRPGALRPQPLLHGVRHAHLRQTRARVPRVPHAGHPSHPHLLLAGAGQPGRSALPSLPPNTAF